ncbi:DUF5682 family protein, partial [Streptomyces sp. NPDC059802]|uniref:DUF5682 family protein n=1 Tax=Streptomyces sp. NPDC059802 TaxID=3346952 RepID=UPI00365FB730
MTTADPRTAVDALAASRAPYLLGVRHHSPALAAVVPALLEEARAEVVCVELPTDFQPWLEHLADPETITPVALAGAGEGGRLSFYPFADFSPELAAVRWARSRGVEVVCCDLPLGDPRWSARALGPVRERDGSEADAPLGATGALDAGPDASPDPAPGDGTARVRRSYAEALAAAGTGRDGDDLWDRAVEVLAPGCAPDAVRRAALGVGWALRADAAVPAADLAREERMRQVIASASADGRRVAAVIGAFHAPALLASTEADAGTEAGAGPAGVFGATERSAVPSEAAPRGAGPRPGGSGSDAAGVWAAGRA